METNDPNMKWCSRCEDFHPKSAFSKDRTRNDGLQSWCKEAKNSYYKTYHQENKEALNARQKKLRDTGYHKQKIIEYSLKHFGCKRGIYKITLDISALGLPEKFLVYIGKCQKTKTYKRRESHKSNLSKPVPGCPIEFYDMAEELRALGLDPVELFAFEIITPGDFLTDLELSAEEISFIKLYSRDFPDECVNREHRYEEEE